MSLALWLNKEGDLVTEVKECFYMRQCMQMNKSATTERVRMQLDDVATHAYVPGARARHHSCPPKYKERIIMHRP